MIIKLILFPVLWGFALHQAGQLTSSIPPGWSDLTNYAIGVQGTLPILILFLKALGFNDKQVFQIILAFEVSFLLVGIGVSSGWWLDAKWVRFQSKHLPPKK